MFKDLSYLLLDLDNTLLTNDMDVFVPAYLSLLSDYAESIIPKDTLVPSLMSATEAMAVNVDPDVTNEEAFWIPFNKMTGLDRKSHGAFFSHFYQTEFNSLKQLTMSHPRALTLINEAKKRGLGLVIATNPMFPLIAVEQRLKWAGLHDKNSPFDLITSYENMHAAKPHPEYYIEILQKLDVSAEQVMMVGDDWDMDMVPAFQVGIPTFWIHQEPAFDPRQPRDRQGTLAEFVQLLLS